MCFVFFWVSRFDLEGFEETLHRCVVVTVAFSAHGPTDDSSRTQILKRTELAEALESWNVSEIREPTMVDL